MLPGLSIWADTRCNKEGEQGFEPPTSLPPPCRPWREGGPAGRGGGAGGCRRGWAGVGGGGGGGGGRGGGGGGGGMEVKEDSERESPPQGVMEVSAWRKA